MTKSIAEHYARSCIHFRGIQHATCKAGVDWRALVGGDNFGIALRTPCLRENNSVVVCAHCHYPTPEEVQAHVVEMEAHMVRQREDMELIGAAHKGQEGRSTVYVCQLCNRAARHVARTPAEISAHLQEAHGISADQILAARGQMAAHMDATEWFQNDDRFTLPDGRELLLRSTRTPRRGENKAVWADMGETRRRKRR